MQVVYESTCKSEALYKYFGNWDFALYIKAVQYFTVFFKFDEYKNEI